MVAHTPGPWTDSPLSDSGITIRSNDHRDVAWVLSQLPTETTANARLIAAAPALLDAVRLTFRVLQNMTTEEFGRGADSEAREALRTAIAKATGEAVPA